MTSPSSLLHLVLMVTKNVLALVKIVSSAGDPKNFIEAIFIVLFSVSGLFCSDCEKCTLRRSILLANTYYTSLGLWNTAWSLGTFTQ